MTAKEVKLPLPELNVFIEALDIACHNFSMKKSDSYYSMRQLVLTPLMVFVI
jgi:hypothetical protein